jgi:hypothetical protein
VTYHVPEKFVSATIHFLYGLSEPEPGVTMTSYMAEHKFALLADLVESGVPISAIETAVDQGRVHVTPWPKKVPRTDFFWVDAGVPELETMADLAVRECYGATAEEPIGGTFASVGAVMGSQQAALAALIFAREQGRLREVLQMESPEMGTGPVYVVRGSFSDKMFQRIWPEEDVDA